MQKPFILIENKVDSRKEFVVTEGKQPTYALFYLKQGNFHLTMKGDNTVLSSGDVVIFPDNEQFIRNVKEEILFVYVKFKFNENCSFLPSLPVGKIKIKDKARLLSSISAYEKLIGSIDAYSLYLKEHLLEDILLQISMENTSISVNEKVKVNDEMLKFAIDFLDKNLNRKISIELLSKTCATNASTLNFRFRRAFNCSTNNFILAHKINNAKRLLLTTNLSIKDIALKTGFDNPYYFSSVFRKKEKVSPSMFRKKVGN